MTQRRPRSQEGGNRPGGPKFFAITMPGLGRLLREEIAGHPGLELEGEPGFDGRGDIVPFRLRRGASFEPHQLRLAEDVFITLAEATGRDARQLAVSLITRVSLERGLSTWSLFVRPLRSSMSFRTITRVLDERRFRRTELRDAVRQAIAANRPRWRVGDPADLEIWVLEYRRAQFIAGLRLSDKRMRQHGEGRSVERHGALRPVVAAAMVRLAGDPPGRILDPCCGSGTLVGEALAAGWDAYGSDVDPEAVEIAMANIAVGTIERADALDLPHADGTFDAVVSNLPFGKQFRVTVDREKWLGQFLREAARVSRPGARVVVLVAPPMSKTPRGLSLSTVHPVRLLGVSTRIWVYDCDRTSETIEPRVLAPAMPQTRSDDRTDTA